MDDSAQNNNGQNPPPPGPGPDLNTPSAMGSNAWSQPIEPTSGTQPQSQTDQGPILPGQFVVTGEDNPAPPPNPIPPVVPAASTPPAPSLPPLESSLPPITPTPFSLDQTADSVKNTLIDEATPPIPTPPAPGSAPLPPPPPPPVPGAGPAVGTTQPDPTPFTPPPTSTSGYSKEPGSGIKKLRIMMIVVGVVVLLIIIGAAAWFFLIGNKTNEAATTQSTDQGPVTNEQPPLPPRTDGGFSQIGEVSATPSGQVESTPAATIPPTF